VTSSSRIQIRLLLTAPINLGPGKVRLLRAISETGSISGAARQLKISYRRAWNMVDTLNQGFPTMLVEANAGGSRGGGARLTALGRTVLDEYEALVARAEAAIAGQSDTLLNLTRSA
jgi:molybdate transport system regulatory protein